MPSQGSGERGESMWMWGRVSVCEKIHRAPSGPGCTQCVHAISLVKRKSGFLAANEQEKECARDLYTAMHTRCEEAGERERKKGVMEEIKNNSAPLLHTDNIIVMYVSL